MLNVKCQVGKLQGIIRTSYQCKKIHQNESLTDLFGGGLWGKVHFLLYIFYMHHFLGHLWVLTVLLEVFRKYCKFKIQFKVLKITVDSAAQFVEFTT